MTCPMCGDTGLQPRTHETLPFSDATSTMREYLLNYHPCLFCPLGEREKPVWEAAAQEWSQPILHRDGQTVIEAGLNIPSYR